MNEDCSRNLHAKALLAYAETLAQKNPEESRKRLEQAAEILRKLGPKPDIERTQANLGTSRAVAHVLRYSAREHL